jgi:hypothetical protein
MLRWLIVPAAFVPLVAVPVAAEDTTRRSLSEGVNENTPGPELFLRAYQVFSHPRCSNCHPRDDRPRWGERSEHIHGMNVQRGVEQPHGGYGRPGMTCPTCHQQKNGELPGSPPGAIDWRLAPLRMGWVGLTAAELCKQFKDLAQHDGREEIDRVIEHIVDPQKLDALVKWAWDPGPGREVPPGDLEGLIQILTWWKKAGAGCPSK